MAFLIQFFSRPPFSKRVDDVNKKLSAHSNSVEMRTSAATTLTAVNFGDEEVMCFASSPSELEQFKNFLRNLRDLDFKKFVY